MNPIDGVNPEFYEFVRNNKVDSLLDWFEVHKLSYYHTGGYDVVRFNEAVGIANEWLDLDEVR